MIGAIILAAGSGSRFGKKKQFEKIDGKTLWKIVYDKVVQFADSSNIIVVGVDIEGGKSRNESLYFGLKKLSKDIDKVIVLEAARPLVRIDQIIEILKINLPSCTFVRPLVNTIVSKHYNYLDRDEYLEILTPQVFDYKLLVKALESYNYINYTDETRVMYEYYNIQPFFLNGDEYLNKVTYELDLIMMRELDKKWKKKQF